MKVTDMRALPPAELAAKVTQWEEELFRARCNKVVGQLQQTHQIQELRRTIARGKTLLHEQTLLTEKKAHGPAQP